MWEAVLARIRASGAGECDGAGVLEQALPAAWVDATFASARQRQFPRALLMSTVIELMLPVALGLQRLVRVSQQALRVNLPLFKEISALQIASRSAKLPKPGG